MGRYLDLADQVIKQGVHVPTHPVEPAASQRETPMAIPSGAVLLARRYDGGNKTLASVPECWCCKTSYQLERLHESKGKTYAFLEPGCGCLDAPQALACCGLCTEHCQCPKPRIKVEEGILARHVEAEMACWHCGARAGETGRCGCSTCGQAGAGGIWKPGDCRACLARRSQMEAQS